MQCHSTRKLSGRCPTDTLSPERMRTCAVLTEAFAELRRQRAVNAPAATAAINPCEDSWMQYAAGSVDAARKHPSEQCTSCHAADAQQKTRWTSATSCSFNTVPVPRQGMRVSCDTAAPASKCQPCDAPLAQSGAAQQRHSPASEKDDSPVLCTQRSIDDHVMSPQERGGAAAVELASSPPSSRMRPHDGSDDQQQMDDGSMSQAAKRTSVLAGLSKMHTGVEHASAAPQQNTWGSSPQPEPQHISAAQRGACSKSLKKSDNHADAAAVGGVDGEQCSQLGLLAQLQQHAGGCRSSQVLDSQSQPIASLLASGDAARAASFAAWQTVPETQSQGIHTAPTSPMRAHASEGGDDELGSGPHSAVARLERAGASGCAHADTCAADPLASDDDAQEICQQTELPHATHAGTAQVFSQAAAQNAAGHTAIDAVEWGIAGAPQANAAHHSGCVQAANVSFKAVAPPEADTPSMRPSSTTSTSTDHAQTTAQQAHNSTARPAPLQGERRGSAACTGNSAGNGGAVRVPQRTMIMLQDCTSSDDSRSAPGKSPTIAAGDKAPVTAVEWGCAGQVHGKPAQAEAVQPPATAMHLRDRGTANTRKPSLDMSVRSASPLPTAQGSTGKAGTKPAERKAQQKGNAADSSASVAHTASGSAGADSTGATTKQQSKRQRRRDRSSLLLVQKFAKNASLHTNDGNATTRTGAAAVSPDTTGFEADVSEAASEDEQQVTPADQMLAILGKRTSGAVDDSAALGCDVEEIEEVQVCSFPKVEHMTAAGEIPCRRSLEWQCAMLCLVQSASLCRRLDFFCVHRRSAAHILCQLRDCMITRFAYNMVALHMCVANVPPLSADGHRSRS